MSDVLTFEKELDLKEYLSDEEVMSIVDDVWLNPEGYIEQFLVIRTKSLDLVRFKLNRTQRDILAIIKEDWLAGKPVRLMILKARQKGASTFIQGLYYTLVSTNPYMTMWVIAHDRESSSNLFAMSERFLDNVDERIKPMVRNRDKKRIRFDNPDAAARTVRPGLDSRIFVDQAKNVHAGRSDTINLLHISERAFWTSTKTVTSLLQAVPMHRKTIVVQESTANGVSDAGGFYDDWWANYGQPNAAWRCLFFPWFIDDEYSMEVEDYLKGDDGRLILIEDLDGEMREDALRDGIEYVNVWGEREVFYLTDEQIRWRRWAIPERCQGDVFTFMQEFPSTPQEAFQQSGRPWFSRSGMEAIGKTITPPIAIGRMSCPRPEWFSSTTQSGLWREDMFHPAQVQKGRAEVKWSADDTGDWWLWRLPEPKEEYLVSVDTAEGGEDGSRAAIQVFSRRTLEQVAEFNGYIDVDLLAHQAAMACWFYNMAFCIPEVNNTGYGFLVEFEKLWKRVYFRKNPDAPIGAPTTWVLGFKTGPSTRPIIVTRAQNYVREEIITIHSSRLYEEMLSFVKDSRGIPRAAGKRFDDLVMAFCLMLELAEMRPVRIEKEQRPITLWDDKAFREHQARMKRRIHGGKKARYF